MFPDAPVKVFLTGRPYMTNDFRRDPNMSQRFVRMSVAQKVMTVPLQVEGRSIGVFHVQDKWSGDYTVEDLERDRETHRRLGL